MELYDYFKALLDRSEKPIVICDLDYRILYLNNKASEEYRFVKKGAHTGSSIRATMSEEIISKIDISVEWFKEDKNNNKVFCYHDKNDNSDIYIKALRDSEGELIGFYNLVLSRMTETGKPYDLD